MSFHLFSLRKRRCAGVPFYIVSVEIKRYAEHLRVMAREINGRAHLVAQGESRGLNLKVSVFDCLSVLRNGQSSIYHTESGAILEKTFLTVLYAYHLWGEHREARVSTGDDGLRISHRISYYAGGACAIR